MADIVDHHIPVSVIISRLEKHRDELLAQVSATPRWRWRRRLILQGAASAYSYEIEQTLGITGSWQPFWKRIRT